MSHCFFNNIQFKFARIRLLSVLGAIALIVACGPRTSSIDEKQNDDEKLEANPGSLDQGKNPLKKPSTNDKKPDQTHETTNSTRNPAQKTVPPIPPKANAPSPKRPFKAFGARLGLYAFEIDVDAARSFPVIRYLYNGVVLTRHEVMQKLANPAAIEFRAIVNDSIAQLPPPAAKNGFMLQSPLINALTKTDAFFFVAIPVSGLMRPSTKHAFGKAYNPYLYHCASKPAGAIQDANYTARFKNMYSFVLPGAIFDERLQGDVRPDLPFGSVVFVGGYHAPSPGEIMVSPCSEDGDLDSAANVNQGHIYDFARAFNGKSNDDKRRIQSFWYAVGKAAEKLFDGTHVKDWHGVQKPNFSLYLNTHGIGVPYLHFRVEITPTHYGSVAGLKDAAQSVGYYKAVFP